KETAAMQINVPAGRQNKTTPSYCESILFNLTTNAIKYKSPDGSPQIEISARKTSLPTGVTTAVTVTANGAGIDLDTNQHKIVVLYKTFHGNNDAVGLGLFMSKNHVEALGGSIDVASDLGYGSTFKVVL